MELMITKLRRPVAAFLLALFICSAPLLGYRRAQAAAITTALTASFAYDALATLFVMMCGYKIYDAITTDENGKAVPTEQSKKAMRDAVRGGSGIGDMTDEEIDVEVKNSCQELIDKYKSGSSGGKEPDMNELAKLALQSSFFKKIYDTYRDTHSQDAEGTEVTETYYEDKAAFYESIPNYYHADGVFKRGELLGSYRYDTSCDLVYRITDTGIKNNPIVGYVSITSGVSYAEFHFTELMNYSTSFGKVYSSGKLELIDLLKKGGCYYVEKPGFSYSNSWRVMSIPLDSSSIINFPVFRTLDLYNRWKAGEIGLEPQYLINPNGVVKPGTNYEIQTNPDAVVNHLEDVTSLEDLQEVLEMYPIEEIVGQPNFDAMADSEPVPDPGTDPLPEEEFPEQDLQDFEVPAAVVNKFPFCIPFDLIKTVQVLAAPPEAPVFELPLYFPRYGIDEKITIDFKQFESLAKISRYFFDLLFILGLILLTRGLIKG